ncbi:hypothetical protein ACJRO7_010366 [Eucalyptus globulus]|uniref:Protein FAR1-RELATED SEQUENCE n=1 Tax=Eucalyptus globulus TaxID=34317 RepID=A0ABD3LBU7_EUCGL
MGFRIWSGQLYQSIVDGLVCNRRFACWKEGFQINSWTGCPAFIRNHPANSQCKSSATTAKVVGLCHKPRIKQLDVVDNGCSSSSGIVSAKRIKPGANEGQLKLETYVGLKFDSANKAYHYYDTYAGNVGFRVHIGQLFRSKNDRNHPSKVGRGAFMMIKRHDNGRLIVDRYQLEHNHELEMQMKEINETLEKLVITKKHNGSLIKKHRANNIGRDWYTVLHNYFQNQQAEDIGFFYAVDQNNYAVPFATFVSVNHHKQLVLLGCTLVADESKESFIWLFETWLRAMSGCHPYLIIADHDDSILQAIAQTKEREHLSPLSSDCKYEYENKYGLRENAWPKEMYEKRENWVPLYLHGTFLLEFPLMEAFLQINEPMEEQCRRFYTLSVFRVFQRESKLQVSGYFPRNEQSNIVTFSSSNFDVICCCQMFESDSVLCRHALRLFQTLDIRELPSRYILHRWTRSYVEFGATSFEKYKLAYEIIPDGGRKLSWQRSV